MGGAVFNLGATVTILNSTVSGNSATGGSGGVNAGDGTGFGGGVFNLNGSVTVVNATFANNTAAAGGSVYNLAHETGDGVTAANATLVLSNSILADATDGVSEAVNEQRAGAMTATLTATDPNLLESAVVNTGGTANTGGVDVDEAMLTPLGDNGGPTATHLPQAGSPALDAGDNTAASGAGLTTDQRGLGRVSNLIVDLGAVERQVVNLSLIVTTADDELDSDLTDPNDLSLREALSITNSNPGADTIFFSSGLNNATINLTLGGLSVVGDLNLNTVNPKNLTVDGGGAQRIFFVDSGTVVIQSMTLANGYAQGGDGGAGAGAGGGGLGAGGAVFVNSGADVTLLNVRLDSNSAQGGDGGGGIGSGIRGGGGGGGVDVPGSAANGGDGIDAVSDGDGGLGGGPSGGLGGEGSTDNALPGNPGGAGGDHSGGGGGGAINSGLSAAGGGSGGDGGFGGGGGGTGTTIGPLPSGGTGGFGGGGAGATGSAAAGGLGGGAGGNTAAVNGAGGGGGAGLGGAFFVREGGSLTIQNTTSGGMDLAGTVNLGVAGSTSSLLVAAQDGEAAGTLGFLQGSGQTLNVDLGGSVTRTLAGSLADETALNGGSNTAGLTKMGTGTLILNDAHLYMGATAVQDGTLGGTGTLLGALNVQNASTLAPGDGGAGSFTAGDTAFAATSTFTVELNGNTAGTGYDQLVVNGDVTLAGATLNASLGYTPATADDLMIVDNRGANPVNGTFNGLAEGATFTLGATEFAITYLGGDGNDVVIFPARADLSLTKDVDNSMPLVGEQVVYTLTITNDGPLDATGVEATDLLPAGVSYVGDDGGGAYDSGTGVWTVGALNNGANATLNITVLVDNPGTIPNTAEITASDLPDPDSTVNNQQAAEDDQASAVVGSAFAGDSGMKVDSLRYVLNYRRGPGFDFLTFRGKLEFAALQAAGLNLDNLGANPLLLSFGGVALPPAPVKTENARYVIFETTPAAFRPRVVVRIPKLAGPLSATVIGADLQSTLTPPAPPATGAAFDVPLQLDLGAFSATLNLRTVYTRRTAAASGVGTFTYGRAPSDLPDGFFFAERVQIQQRFSRGFGDLHRAVMTLCFRPAGGALFDPNAAGADLTIGTYNEIVGTDPLLPGFANNTAGTIQTYIRPQRDFNSNPVAPSSVSKLVFDQGRWRVTVVTHWMNAGIFGTPDVTPTSGAPDRLTLDLQLIVDGITTGTSTLLRRQGVHYVK
ncbi:MAG: DUF11 domain-containing protein [Planctomycetota bacterium]|nr:DUF11 domain-containing protein [Planctomycetota bacterium]